MARIERVVARSGDLAERGAGVRFTVDRNGRTVPAFAVRCDGAVYAYVNACAHEGVELDWEHGRFFDAAGRLLECATHGARFDPASGRCVAGPCKGAALAALEVVERAGHVVLIGSG